MTVAEFLLRLLVEPETVVTVKLVGADRETMREYRFKQDICIANIPSWMHLVSIGFVEIRGKHMFSPQTRWRRTTASGGSPP